MLRLNADRMALYLQWEVRVLLPTLVALLALALVVRIVRGGSPWIFPGLGSHGRRVATFLAVWGLPPLAFYLGVYSGYGNGPSGYALILLPPIAIACALAGGALVSSLRWPVVWSAVVAVAAVSATGIALAGHAHDVPDGNYGEHDAWVANWLGLPAGFPASNTSIVTAYNFAHVWYYYPDYHAYEYRPPGKAVGEVPDFLLIQEAQHHEATPDWYDEIADRDTPGPHPLDPGVRNLVLFDFQLAGENGGERQLKDDVPVHEAWLPNGWRVLYVEVVPERPNLEDYFTMDGAL